MLTVENILEDCHLFKSLIQLQYRYRGWKNLTIPNIIWRVSPHLIKRFNSIILIRYIN